MAATDNSIQIEFTRDEAKAAALADVDDATATLNACGPVSAYSSNKAIREKLENARRKISRALEIARWLDDTMPPPA